MSAISAFLPFIIPFVHDCPNIAGEIAARFAVIEFCEKTDWMQYEVDPITIQAGVYSYEIESPQDTLALRVKSATVLNQDMPLIAKTQDQLTALYGDWRAEVGTPIYITQITRDELRLVPSPDTRVAQGLRLLISTRPTNDAPDIEDAIFNYWAETIGYGARARLKEMAGQPYYDPANAPAVMCSRL